MVESTPESGAQGEGAHDRSHGPRPHVKKTGHFTSFPHDPHAEYTRTKILSVWVQNQVYEQAGQKYKLTNNWNARHSAYRQDHARPSSRGSEHAGDYSAFRNLRRSSDFWRHYRGTALSAARYVWRLSSAALDAKLMRCGKFRLTVPYQFVADRDERDHAHGDVVKYARPYPSRPGCASLLSLGSIKHRPKKR